MTKSKPRTDKAQPAPVIERGKIPDIARTALYTGFDIASSEAHRLFAHVGGSDKVRMRIVRKIYRRFLHSLEIQVKQQQRVWRFKSQVQS